MLLEFFISDFVVAQEENSFIQAAAQADIETITKVLEEDATCINTIDAKGWSALHYCLYYGSKEHLAMIPRLLQAGIDVHIVTKPERMSALHFCNSI